MSSDADPEDVQLALQIIVCAGNARMEAYRGLQFARDHIFEMAAEQLKKADIELNQGHKVQTQLISRESRQNKVVLSLLLVHAMDSLMNSMSERNLIEEIIEIHRRLSDMKKADGEEKSK
jgi:cellobiose PTS system EIIA component